MPPSPTHEGKERITPEDIDALIEFNRRLMVRRGGHHHAANRPELERILLQELDQFRGIEDRRTRIFSMAAWILYNIAERNTFYDGRKNSAWAMTSKFLNWNGHYMPVATGAQKKDLHRLLTGVQRHSKHFEDVRAFMYGRVISF